MNISFHEFEKSFTVQAFSVSYSIFIFVGLCGCLAPLPLLIGVCFKTDKKEKILAKL
jgi:hypothetical protein